jgi:ATP-dependent DNA helicase RecG
MTLADLGRKSVRRNALLADLLHRIDFIEKAGTGIKRIRDEVRQQGCPEPVFENNGFFTAIFRPNPEVRALAAAQPAAQAKELDTGEVTGEVTREVTGEVTDQVSREVLRLLGALHGEMPRQEMQKALGLRHEDHFRQAYLGPALEAAAIERTLPGKPRSSKQRYRITAFGLEALKKAQEKA